MVSFWPWRGDDTSAEAFEKSLSALALKISKTTTRVEGFKKQSRSWKASVSLFGGLSYLCALLICTLLVGWRNWGPYEYTGLAGGPLLLYGVHWILTRYFNYRISTTQAYLDSLNKQRDDTLDKLKAATKYNSTQQLLEKYGSKPSTPKADGEKKQKPAARKSDVARLPFNPPPTANIPRGPANSPPQLLQRPQSPPEQFLGGPNAPARPLSPQGPKVTEEFAPNAYADPSGSIPPPASFETKWYDRILDAIMGEDENSAKNRPVLLCSHCRFVNGCAPPGVKSLEEIGRWQCSNCRGWNGVENEVAKAITEAKKVQAAETLPTSASPIGEESDKDIHEGAGTTPSDDDRENSSGLAGDNEETPAKSTRSKSKSKSKSGKK